MKTSNVQKIIQYILGIAGQQEDFGFQELGPIHVLKYIYLADIAYAERNNGKTFTEIPWKFHNFGPWSYEACEMIEPTVLSAGAAKKILSSSKYEDDFIRYKLCDDALVDNIIKELPSVVISDVKRAIKKFGSDTSGLLHYVYTTKPMLSAAPGELLDFTSMIIAAPPAEPYIEEDTPAQPTKKQQKRQREKVQQLKVKIQGKLKDLRTSRKLVAPQPAPRYDEVFYKGQKVLDLLAGTPIAAEENRAYFSDNIWKSQSRYDPEIS